MVPYLEQAYNRALLFSWYISSIDDSLPIIKKITFHAGIRIDKERPVLDRDVAWFTGNPIQHGRRKHAIYDSFCNI